MTRDTDQFHVANSLLMENRVQDVHIRAYVTVSFFGFVGDCLEFRRRHWSKNQASFAHY